MTLTINPKTYRSLLADVMPKVIETEADYQHALQEFEKLHVNRSLNPEELALYRLWVLLIETYEEKHFPFPFI